jgi:NAD(P)-dependent dehydrogenase (short-subunit alcohol dehydrogenase family)
MKRLQGKVAIVTGAGRGIGGGIAIAYAREGANVLVASRTKSTIDSTVAEIQAEGGYRTRNPLRRRSARRRVRRDRKNCHCVRDGGHSDNAQGFGTERRTFQLDGGGSMHA